MLTQLYILQQFIPSAAAMHCQGIRTMLLINASGHGLYLLAFIFRQVPTCLLLLVILPATTAIILLSIKYKRKNSELDKVNQLLRNSTEQLSGLSSIVANDLRNPLGIISGCIDEVLDTVSMTGEQYELLILVQKNSKLLDERLRHLYVLSRIGSLPKPQPLDLNEVLKEAVSLHDLNEYGNVSFKAGILPVIWAHRAMMTELFYYLLHYPLRMRNAAVPLQLNLMVSMQSSGYLVFILGFNIPYISAGRAGIIATELSPAHISTDQQMNFAIKIAQEYGGYIISKLNEAGEQQIILYLPGTLLAIQNNTTEQKE